MKDSFFVSFRKFSIVLSMLESEIVDPQSFIRYSFRYFNYTSGLRSYLDRLFVRTEVCKSGGMSNADY